MMAYPIRQLEKGDVKYDAIRIDTDNFAVDINAFSLSLQNADNIYSDELEEMKKGEGPCKGWGLFR